MTRGLFATMLERADTKEAIGLNRSRLRSTRPVISSVIEGISRRGTAERCYWERICTGLLRRISVLGPILSKAGFAEEVDKALHRRADCHGH